VAGIATEGFGIIENNLITNNHDGIDIEGPNTVINNTIENNYIGVQQVVNFEFPTIIFNNFQNNSYNLFLSHLVTNSVNATCNYWGTTNQTAISNSIYDNKEDSSLGTVNFVPFLTEPNPEVSPTSTLGIPEFPSWIILPIFMIATLLIPVVYFKKRKH
jgi:parallel beta-helix repeat protein